MLKEKDFFDSGTFDVFNGKKSKRALKTLPENLWLIAYRKFTFLARANTLSDLRIPPNNRLESLKGDRKGQYSIRINDQYRICFIWKNNQPTCIEVVDYH